MHSFAAKDALVTAEQRFVDIEIKLAHQEDLVDTLNQMVYQQQKRIDQLEQLLGALAQRLREGGGTGQSPLNERPPHY